MQQLDVRRNLTAFGLALLFVLVGIGPALAAVWTDQPDYPPGSTVFINGDGMLAAETVRVETYLPDGSLAQSHTVTATPSGAFSDTFVTPTSPPVFGTYSVRATGLTSGNVYTNTFLDGNIRARYSGPVTPSPATYTVTFTTYSAANCNGGVLSSGTESRGSNGTPAFGVGNTQSIKLQAAATSNNGYGFVNWTNNVGSTTGSTGDPFTLLAADTICVPGFSGNGTRDYFANYASNTAPIVNRTNASVVVNEGQTANNTGTWSDSNSGDSVTLSASAGAVIKNTTGPGNSGTWSWSYGTTDGPDQSQTVTITANDGHGGISSTTFSLTVNNLPPTVTLSGPAAADESPVTEHTYTYTINDPGLDAFSFAAGYPTCGSGGTPVGSPAIGDGSFKCKFLDGPASPTVAIRVQDSDSALSNEAIVPVTVNNVAPTVDLVGDSTASEGQTKTYTYAVSDPGNDPNPIRLSCAAPTVPILIPFRLTASTAPSPMGRPHRRSAPQPTMAILRITSVVTRLP